ncbi:hypothetical protein HZM62_004135 [Salmonella enterica]|nr:hypothetical protein [Salmonella enterica]
MKKGIEVIKVDKVSDIVSFVRGGSVYYIILNVSPRNYIWLLYNIRVTDSYVPIILTEEKFLFSDRVVSEFFGNIIPVELESFLDIPPGKSPLHYLASHEFSGPFFYCIEWAEYKTKNEVVYILQRKLEQRLRYVLNSDRTYEVTITSMRLGFDTKETARLFGLSNKSIYHYRYMVMKKLSIKNYAKEFIQSLTFTI